jgi:hypothetical protein
MNVCGDAIVHTRMSCISLGKALRLCVLVRVCVFVRPCLFVRVRGSVRVCL